MANGHGGDRVPERPAAASGPGRLSRRTDGQAARYVKGLEYGEGQKLLDTQKAAPMAQAPGVPDVAAAAAAAGGKQAAGPPLMAEPTMRPDEPVTAGSRLGPGPGPPEPPRLAMSRELLQRAALLRYRTDPSSENLIAAIVAMEEL